KGIVRRFIDGLLVPAQGFLRNERAHRVALLDLLGLLEILFHARELAVAAFDDRRLPLGFRARCRRVAKCIARFPAGPEPDCESGRGRKPDAFPAEHHHPSLRSMIFRMRSRPMKNASPSTSTPPASTIVASV